MPGSTLTLDRPTTGFFGKLPSRGDFIGRYLRILGIFYSFLRIIYRLLKGIRSGFIGVLVYRICRLYRCNIIIMKSLGELRYSRSLFYL